MADQPPTPAAPPANAGFKLKLKLGGSNSSTTVSAAQPGSSASVSTASPTFPSTATMPTAASTSQSAAASTSAGSSETTAQAGTEEASMQQDGHDYNDDENDNEDANDFALQEMEEYGGEYATSKKAAAKLRRMRKTSTPATASTSSSNALPMTDADTSMGDASAIHGAEQDTSMQSIASPGPSTKPESAKYETSIGSIVLPAATASAAGPSRKRRAPAAEGVGTGLGRGWRKGLKGYQRPDGSSPGPGAGRGETVSATPSTGTSIASSSRKRKTQTTLAAGIDESSLDRNADPEDFVPAMAPSGGLVTSEKWANGLPGGNEQSRLTASMASAVNRQFPVGPPPKTGSGFLQPQPLDKNTPPPRSWKKIKREIVGPSGVPFTVMVWQGDNESKYSDYMIEHPRPAPVDKKATAIPAIGSSLEAGSPVPEGSYPPSDGTPADAASESGPSQSHTGTPTGRGSTRGRSRAGRAAGPRKKPGPPKKTTAVPPPIISSSAAVSAPVSPLPDALAASAPSNTMDAGNSDVSSTLPKLEALPEQPSQVEAKTEQPMDSPALAA